VYYSNYRYVKIEKRWCGGNFGYAREIIERDYATWSGKILERFYHDLYAASGSYNRIGRYWERGNKNEIDLVAVNDLRKEMVIAEIKRNKSRITAGSATEGRTAFAGISGVSGGVSRFGAGRCGGVSGVEKEQFTLGCFGYLWVVYGFWFLSLGLPKLTPK